MKCSLKVCQLAHGRAKFYTRQGDSRSCLPPVRRRVEPGIGCDQLSALGWLTPFQPFGPREVYGRGTLSSPSRGQERTSILE